MNKSTNKPIPTDPRRIILINPTRYLGNLLLAGGLIQDLAAQCHKQGKEFVLVLDSAFAELCAAAFPDTRVLYYPRQEIARASSVWRKLNIFMAFVKKIRDLRADLAFNIEEDTVTSRLTQLSGARFRMGSSPQRHGLGYEHVLQIDYTNRVAELRHRWHSFHEVFVAAGLRTAQMGYINLNIKQCSKEVLEKLLKNGVLPDRALVAVHPSATKEYKKWPESAFKELCNILIKNGMQPILLGAGQEDMKRCQQIMQDSTEIQISSEQSSSEMQSAEAALPIVNMCNQLSLAELAQVFLLCTGIVGNDSGPFHLAAAQKLPGVVIFGPSDAGIWGPLGRHSRVLQRSDLCDPLCSRRSCHAGYRCLHAITPSTAFDNLTEITKH